MIEQVLSEKESRANSLFETFLKRQRDRKQLEKKPSVKSITSENTRKQEQIQQLKALSKAGSFRDRAKLEAEASQLEKLHQLYSSFRSRGHGSVQPSER